MISTNVKEVTIGKNIFFIRRFAPFVALEILGDLQKQFAGPILTSIDGKENAKDENGNIVINPESANKLMNGFSNLSAKLDGKTLRKIAETLIDKEYISVSIDGADPRKLDASAQGLSLESVSDIIELCWEILKHNYEEVISRIANPTIAARFLVRK
jgi:hypothetical protein